MTALNKFSIRVIIGSLATFWGLSSQASPNPRQQDDFQGARFAECDQRFHSLESLPRYDGMAGRDQVVNGWAECWKRSMVSELDKRLLIIKKSDSKQYSAEMKIQKLFNEATQRACQKKDSGGTMHGIPRNWCRVGAYQYRTRQAIQINQHQLEIPMKPSLEIKIEMARKEKAKTTDQFKEFILALCAMPKETWKEATPSPACEQKAFTELNRFEFTDDPDDLS